MPQGAWNVLAKVKADGPGYPITAFAGQGEYTKREWRLVPTGFEDEARRHPYLEVQEDEPLPELELEPITPDGPPVKRKGRK